MTRDNLPFTRIPPSLKRVIKLNAEPEGIKTWMFRDGSTLREVNGKWVKWIPIEPVDAVTKPEDDNPFPP